MARTRKEQARDEGWRDGQKGRPGKGETLGRPCLRARGLQLIPGEAITNGANASRTRPTSNFRVGINARPRCRGGDSFFWLPARGEAAAAFARANHEIRCGEGIEAVDGPSMGALCALLLCKSTMPIAMATRISLEVDGAGAQFQSRARTHYISHW